MSLSAVDLSAAETSASAQRLEALTAFGLGFFLLLQCFTLPVLAVGPSWTLWQSLPDLALWFTGLCSVLYFKPVSTLAQRQIWWALLFLVGLSMVGFGLLFIYNDPLLSTELRFGGFALYRWFQVLVVFWAASRLTYTRALLERWRRLTLVAFTVTCTGVIVTAFSSVPIKFLGAHLPRGLGVSGPWEAYYRYYEVGLGFVGFNHGYAALQVMLLGALLIYLNQRCRRAGNSEWILLLALVASFLCNSRAGLAGCLVFAVLQLLRYPVRAALTLGSVGVIGGLLWSQVAPNLQTTTQRQATVLAATDPNNLAGRADIWQTIIQQLLADPYRLIVGSGLGSAVINNGNNAHNMVLQVLFEAGLVGVMSMGAFFALLLTLLLRAGPQGRVVLNVTIGFLVTSLTQETFFPNVAFGVFLPLYALVVALVLAPQPRSSQPRGPT